jgi:excisionase family DNA binding protein
MRIRDEGLDKGVADALPEPLAGATSEGIRQMSRANYSVKQLAKRLQVSDKTIYAMIARGELQSFKFGRQIRIRGDVVGALECGLSDTGDIGRLQESTGTGSNGGDRYAPVIAPPPSGPLQTTGSPSRARR